MLMVKHQKNNTLYFVPARHGSQSMARFVKSRSDFRIISEVMSDHLRGKIRVISRNPMEKFQSGLSWYLDFLLKGNHHDYDTTRIIIHGMMLSGVTMSIFENNCNVWSGNTDLANYVKINIRDHFKYHLGEYHMAFTNLSLVLLVGLGLDIEVFDVTDIDQIYKEFRFVDQDVNDQGKYQQSEDKKQYYSDITEIYMDTLESLSQEARINHYYNPSKAEFNELMAMEFRAYNALNSDHMLEDCKSFLFDLIKGILDPKSKIEISYMIHNVGTIDLVARIMNLIPYKSDMYPVVGLLLNIVQSFVPGSWQDHLQGYENLLNN